MVLNESALATLAFVVAVVVVLVDGRNAVSIATLGAGVALAIAVLGGFGLAAAGLLMGAAAAAALAVPLARAAAHRLTWTPGVDSQVPVVVPPDALFGPRSIRVLLGVLVLPAASWISFNVPIGTATTVRGVLFPVALLWGCGAVRLLTARSVADVAIGVATAGLAGGAGWLLSGGREALAAALVAASLAPAVAAVAGWLSGRHASATLPA